MVLNFGRRKLLIGIRYLIPKENWNWKLKQRKKKRKLQKPPENENFFFFKIKYGGVISKEVKN